MKILIVVALVWVVLLCFASTTSSDSPPEGQNAPTSDLIAYYADLYKVSPVIMTKVIKCESSFDPNAVGDGGHSFGLVQIHLPSHKEVTKEQALDRNYAVEFLAKGLSTGRGKQWTCWRKLGVV